MARRVLAHRVSGATAPSVRIACAALAALAVGGCSITAPFERAPAAASAADNALVTGSIGPKAEAALQPGQVSPFSPKLDQEDWRRAKAALATALDPQGNGSVVRWENGDSGHKGSFAPVGNSFLVKDEICRAFIAGVSPQEPEQWFQGTACRASATDWTLKDVKPWKRPA